LINIARSRGPLLHEVCHGRIAAKQAVVGGQALAGVAVSATHGVRWPGRIRDTGVGTAAVRLSAL
jgi:hypothetical protein